MNRFEGTFRVPSSTWPSRVAKRLHALAESNPTPDQYRRERARILREGGINDGR